MWLRRAFYRWMFPAAIVLPLWLLVGWVAFAGSGWALLGVLFIAIPSVLLSQLILSFLIRARTSVREERALSWADVGGLALWQAFIVATGFYASWFGAAVVGALVCTVAIFWSTIWQLWRETTSRMTSVLRAADGTAYIPPPARRASEGAADVFVITEQDSPR